MMNTPTNAQEDLNSADARANMFPQYLMKLLNDEVAPEALWWLPDGEAFALCPEKVADDVLDKHFQKTKYSSFIRRLHNEGFRRQTRKYKKMEGLTLPEGTVVLSHSSFQRDAPDLLESFYKKTASGNNVNNNKAPKANALHRAKAAENKLSSNLRVSNMLDAAAAGRTSPLGFKATKPVLSEGATTDSSLLGLGALPRLGAGAGLPDLSALYGNYASQAPMAAAAGPFGLNKHIAALRQARLAEDMNLNMARLREQQQQQQRLSRSNSAESQTQNGKLLNRTSSSESASHFSSAPSTTAAAAIMDSQLRLQQMRWENSRRQLEEQTQRLSAMEALRLRAAAAYSTNPQWL